MLPRAERVRSNPVDSRRWAREDGVSSAILLSPVESSEGSVNRIDLHIENLFVSSQVEAVAGPPCWGRPVHIPAIQSRYVSPDGVTASPIGVVSVCVTVAVRDVAVEGARTFLGPKHDIVGGRPALA